MDYVIGNLGVKIKVGDFVVYPGRARSELWMNYGIVVGIFETYIKVARGRKYLTFDIGTNEFTHTKYFRQTYNIRNIELISKVNFYETNFADINDEYNELFTSIFKEILQIEQWDSEDGC
jgi:hypothetical protein